MTTTETHRWHSREAGALAEIRSEIEAGLTDGRSYLAFAHDYAERAEEIAGRLARVIADITVAGGQVPQVLLDRYSAATTARDFYTETAQARDEEREREHCELLIAGIRSGVRIRWQDWDRADFKMRWFTGKVTHHSDRDGYHVYVTCDDGVHTMAWLASADRWELLPEAVAS
jgi:hypothetical protein